MSETVCGRRGHETRQAYCFCQLPTGHTGQHRCADGYEWETDLDLSAALEAAERKAENVELLEALEDMVWQFGYRGVRGKRRMLGTGGLSALEGAFAVMGWKDPHYPRDSIGCDWPQCLNWGDACGCPHPDGYKHYCSEHSREGSALARAALKERHE